MEIIKPLLFLTLLTAPTFSQVCPDRPVHGSRLGSSSQFCQNCPFHRSRLGNSTITVVTDGPELIPLSFFTTVPQAAVERAYKAAFRKTNPAVLQLNTLVFDTPHNRILVDTGAFNLPQFAQFLGKAGKLLQHLEHVGITPDSIDSVILTHAHADHTAGLIDKAGNPVFKNAKIYVGKIEHEFWASDPIPEVPRGLDQEFLKALASGYLPAIKPYIRSRKVIFVNDQETPLPGVKFLHTPGHTPGHMTLELSSGAEKLLVIGDAWISRPDQLQHPEWGLAPETDHDAAFSTRIKLLERAARSRERCLVYHEQYPGLGFVVKDDAAFDWVPEAGISFGEDSCEG